MTLRRLSPPGLPPPPARSRLLAAERTVEDKSEGGVFDPVTDADRDAERAMRDLIEAEYPDHGIAGEELGERAARGAIVWSLDPIDGTRSFICGLPSWTTLIALLEDRRAGPRPDRRADARRALSRRRQACLAQWGAVRTSACRTLGEARLSTTDPYLFEGEEAAGFARLRDAARVTRYGHDAYGYARLAAGTSTSSRNPASSRTITMPWSR